MRDARAKWRLPNYGVLVIQMDTVLDRFTSVEFWVGVVLVSFLINLLAAYTKPWLDEKLSTLSSFWANRTKRKRDEQIKLMEYLKENPQEQMYVIADEMRCRLRFVVLTVVAMGMLILVFLSPQSWRTTLGFWFSLLIMIYGLKEHLDAMKLSKLICETRILKKIFS